MELRHYINLIWKWMWLIVLAVAIAAVSSYLASRAATPLYRTKTTLMVGRATESLSPDSYDLFLGQQLAPTYIELVKRQPVLEGAIKSLDLKMGWQSLVGRVSANQVGQTQLLEIAVVDSDPYRAKVLADAIAQQLVLQAPGSAENTDQEQEAFTRAQITDLQNKITEALAEASRLSQEMDASNSARQIADLDTQIGVLESKIGGWQSTYSQLLLTQGGSPNTLSVVEEAALPRFPISPNVGSNVFLASAIGLVLAIGGIFLIEYLDDTIKSPEDIVHVVGLPTLGMIARIEGEEYPDKLISIRKPLSPTVEAYRVLRTNIQFSSVDNPARTLMLTSPGPSEGKSVTIANLAVVMAQSDLKVIVVDTDLRRPVQHRIFGLPNRHGLSDALLQAQLSLEERLQSTGIDNLWLMSSGSLPPNPAELLASDRMKALVEELKNYADIVLFDSPPVLVVADAKILGSFLDGVVLVNDAGRTRRTEARRAVEELRRVRVNILGVVLNRLIIGPRTSYSYYSYSYYYDDSATKKRTKTRRNGREKQAPSLQTSEKAGK